MVQHEYDEQFFTVADGTAAESADGVIGWLSPVLKIGSVLDVGCARGVWLSRWTAHGTADIFGVDGPYISAANLHIPRDRFIAHDLNTEIDLGRQFDLVQSLEVAEHLPAESAERFVDSLTRHGKLILFSAAIPGQGGEFHINEQPLDYWRTKFESRGYIVFDYLRPRVVDDSRIFFWYRHNTLLYAHDSIADTLPPEILATRIPAGQPLADRLPLSARMMIAAIGPLPMWAVNVLSRLKQRSLILIRRLANQR